VCSFDINNHNLIQKINVNDLLPSSSGCNPPFCHDLAVLKDEKYAICPLGSGHLLLFDTVDLNKNFVWSAHHAAVACCTFIEGIVENRLVVVSAGNDCRLSIWAVPYSNIQSRSKSAVNRRKNKAQYSASKGEQDSNLSATSTLALNGINSSQNSPQKVRLGCLSSKTERWTDSSFVALDTQFLLYSIPHTAKINAMTTALIGNELCIFVADLTNELTVYHLR